MLLNESFIQNLSKSTFDIDITKSLTHEPQKSLWLDEKLLAKSSLLLLDLSNPLSIGLCKIKS